MFSIYRRKRLPLAARLLRDQRGAIAITVALAGALCGLRRMLTAWRFGWCLAHGEGSP